MNNKTYKPNDFEVQVQIIRGAQYRYSFYKVKSGNVKFQYRGTVDVPRKPF